MLVVTDTRSTWEALRLAVMNGVVDDMATLTRSPYPPTAVRVIVEVPVAPANMNIVEGLALMRKSGVATVALWAVSGTEVGVPSTMVTQTSGGTLVVVPHPVWKPIGVPAVLETTW